MVIYKCDRCNHEIKKKLETSNNCKTGCTLNFPYPDERQTKNNPQISYTHTQLLLCDGCLEEFWLSWWTACGATQPEAVKHAYNIDQ
ncbi:hypothetical protein HHJ81_03665 [Mobiluncus mulieris]|uniref:Uncharacterized protein n=1 Tax=Mobiluncus mulieris TaxID=2052 RepID=A0A7Y0TWD6_9ACTO|nr:hypothetical protein [Mobiluncus mulieris]MCU9995379.1 hypothetical protein [Mobiluncus mulieris]NMW60201.1 hypothetical protein [Mobiluncus mulieris]NMW64463.1 hypothetical protein [Mobiluncus mulieris]